MQYELKIVGSLTTTHLDWIYDILFFETVMCDKCLHEHKEYHTFENTSSIVGYDNAVKIAEEIIEQYESATFSWANLTPNQWNELDFLYGEDAENIVELSKQLDLSFEESLKFEFVKKTITVKLNNKIYKLKS